MEDLRMRKTNRDSAASFENSTSERLKNDDPHFRWALNTAWIYFRWALDIQLNEFQWAWELTDA